MRRIALSVGVSLVVLQPGGASASCDCTSEIAAYAKQTQMVVNQHTDQVGNQIIDAIMRGVQQLSAYIERQSAADARLADATEQIETLRQRALARAEAEATRYTITGEACIAATAAARMTAALAAGSDVYLNGFDFTNSLRNWSRGNDDTGVVNKAGVAIAAYLVSARDQHSGELGVLDPTSDVRALTNNLTLIQPEGEDPAVLALLVNLLDPTPPPPLTAEEMNTPTGITEAARRQVDDARRSTTIGVFEFLLNLQAARPANEIGSWLNAVMPPGYAAKIPADGISELQMLDLVIRSKYPNPAWHASMAGSSPEAVQRELLQVQALSLYVDWLRLDLERRTAMVDAVDLARSLDAGDVGIVPVQP
jgi:hypothetical protein